MSSRLFYSVDQSRFHMAVRKVLRTERKHKFGVATKTERGKAEAIVVCVNATGSNWIPFSLLSKEKNNDVDVEYAFTLSPDIVIMANAYIQVQEFCLGLTTLIKLSPGKALAT